MRTRITKRMIERYGWEVWDAAVRNAEELAGRGIDAKARRAGRSWLRSLNRTREALNPTQAGV